MAAASGVIDWDEAMEQCGDDEEFLRELLADLRGETDAQVAKIEETIRVRIYLYSILPFFHSVPHTTFSFCALFLLHSSHSRCPNITESHRCSLSSNNAGIACN